MSQHIKVEQINKTGDGQYVLRENSHAYKFMTWLIGPSIKRTIKHMKAANQVHNDVA